MPGVRRPRSPSHPDYYTDDEDDFVAKRSCESPVQVRDVIVVHDHSVESDDEIIVIEPDDDDIVWGETVAPDDIIWEEPAEKIAPSV